MESELFENLEGLKKENKSLRSFFYNDVDNNYTDIFILLMYTLPSLVFHNSDKIFKAFEDANYDVSKLKRYFISINDIEQLLDKINQENQHQYTLKCVLLDCVYIYLHFKVLMELFEIFNVNSNGNRGRVKPPNLLHEFYLKLKRALKESKKLRESDISFLEKEEVVERLKNKVTETDFFIINKNYLESTGLDPIEQCDFVIENTKLKYGPRKILGLLLNYAIIDVNAAFNVKDNLNNLKSAKYFIYHPLFELMANDDFKSESHFDGIYYEKSYKMYFYENVLIKTFGLNRRKINQFDV